MEPRGHEQASRTLIDKLAVLAVVGTAAAAPTWICQADAEAKMFARVTCSLRAPRSLRVVGIQRKWGSGPSLLCAPLTMLGIRAPYRPAWSTGWA